jgi:hypothetical protein
VDAVLHLVRAVIGAVANVTPAGVPKHGKDHAAFGDAVCRRMGKPKEAQVFSARMGKASRCYARLTLADTRPRTPGSHRLFIEEKSLLE